MKRAVLREIVAIAANLAGLAARLAEEADADPDDMLTEPEAADLARVSIANIRRARSRGELTAYGKQRSRTYRRGDVEAWISSRVAPVVRAVDDDDLSRRVARLAAARARKTKGRAA